MKEPTHTAIRLVHSELLQREGYYLATLGEVSRQMWATYTVYKMRLARTHRELLDLRGNAVLRLFVDAKCSRSGETPAFAYDVAIEKLANGIWTNGKKIRKFYNSQLFWNSKDKRLPADLEKSGYVFFHRGELRGHTAQWVENKGVIDNIDGWIADTVHKYLEKWPLPQEVSNE